MKKIPTKSILMLCALAITSTNAQEPAKLTALSPEAPHIQRLAVADSAGNEVKVTGPLPSFVKVWLEDDPKKTPLEFDFNKDATQITIYLPNEKPEGVTSSNLNFLLTENSATLSDGVVILSALDSKVVGKQAKLESHPGSHRIGFWGNADDLVRWNFAIPEGEYTVDLVYSRASKTGTEVEIVVGETILPLTLEQTGSWYRYRIVELGNVSVSKSDEPIQVDTRVKKIVNGGVMNLKALIFTPVKADKK